MGKPKHFIVVEQALEIAKSAFKSNPAIQNLLKKYPEKKVSYGLIGGHKDSVQYEISLCLMNESLNEKDILSIDSSGNTFEQSSQVLAKIVLDKLMGSFTMEIIDK